jgi:hypothetical protein
LRGANKRSEDGVAGKYLRVMAANKSTPAYDYLIKLMLIGDSGRCQFPSLRRHQPLNTQDSSSGVGKSSLLLRFSDDSFGKTV